MKFGESQVCPTCKGRGTIWNDRKRRTFICHACNGARVVLLPAFRLFGVPK